MAFKSDMLNVLTYANGFTLWHYKTPDVGTDVHRPGYFSEASDMLRTGDMIMVHMAPEGGQFSATILLVLNTDKPPVSVTSVGPHAVLVCD